MTRKFTFTILAMLFAILGPGAEAWGQDVFYEKCSSLSDIENGGTYIIVISDGGNGTNSYAVQQNSTNYVAITTQADGSIKNPNSSIIWTATSTNNGTTFTFKCNSKYIYCSGGNTTLSGTGTNSTNWFISLLSSDVFKMQVTDNSGRYIGWSGSKFAAYANSNFSNQIATSSNLAQYSGALFIYKEKTASPVATLESISIKTAPTKLTYTEGEYFDPTGLVITKYFDDETTSDLAYDGNETAFSFNPTLTTPLATTNTQVEITVGGKSANQAITVNAAPKYTITFMDRTNQVNQLQIIQGAAVGELPEDPDDIGTYKFQGWAEQFEGTVQDAPAFVTSATIPTSDMTYYAVYAEVSGSGESTTESSTIEAIALANSWQDAQPYSDASFGNITVTGSGTGNNRKYYTSDKSWRFYSSGDGKITFTVPEDNFISNVALTGTSYFTSAPTGWNYSNNTFTPESGTNSNTITISNGNGTSKITAFSITYGGGETYSNYTQNPVAKTLVSIEVSGTPAEFWKGDAFNHNGMTVTANWDDESQTDVTADCEFSTPDMTTAGEKEITVTYQEQSDTYTINVQTITNTLEEPYTVAQAIAIIDAGKDLNSKVYVAGTISQLDGDNNAPEYHNLTYWIADESSETKFEVYRGRNLGDTDFNTNNDILIGADVIVYGKITKFQTTYEFSQGNYLVSYTAPEVEEYDIILNQNEHGSISADLETASAGQIVTLTATPNEHYHFVEWTVLDGEAEEVTVTNNQFTMPASDVEVEATFEEDATYTFTYYYNGDFYTDDLAYAGALITLEEDPDMSPEGFSFVGWSTSVASTDVIEGTTYTLNENVDFYAVFEKTSTSRENDEVSFVKVTEAPEDWSGEYLLVYEGGENSSHDIFPAVAWTGVEAVSCGAEVTITSNTIAEKPETAVTLTIAPMGGGYSIRVNGGENDGKYIGRSANSNGLSFTSEAQLNTLAITNGEAVITAAAGRTMKYNYASDQLRFRYYGAGQQAVQLYKKSGGEAPVITGLYTRVYDDDYAFEGENLTVEGPSIVVSGYTLTVTGTMTNTNAANLVIEDGAQLYYTNGENVNATFQKSINGYTGTNDHYYLIANPTDNTTVANLINPEGYDLYTFNPAGDGNGKEWINMKNLSMDVENGIGYLYANSIKTTLEFAGNLTPAGSSDIELTYANAGEGFDFPGFNLIGNPFACNAYPTDGNGNFMPFYKTNETGSELTLVENVEAIAPCEGFFVEAATTDQSVTISTTAPTAPASLLNITVSQNRGSVIDRAIVSFNGSANLHKFMLNPSHTNLSIAKDGETFAAVSSETKGELPVSFKAETTGTYTISVNTENVTAGYIHLIDNMTGTDVDLLATPSYTFIGSPRDNENRFTVKFEVSYGQDGDGDEHFAYQNGSELVVNGEGTLQIFDILGRVVISEEVHGQTVNVGGLNTGAYIVRLTGESVKTQKIVVR